MGLSTYFLHTFYISELSAYFLLTFTYFLPFKKLFLSLVRSRLRLQMTQKGPALAPAPAPQPSRKYKSRDEMNPDPDPVQGRKKAHQRNNMSTLFVMELHGLL